MKYFSLPADFKTETIDKYVELNNKFSGSKVSETYGQITVGAYTGSGRSIKLLPKTDFADLEKYVKYSQDRGIKFNYTFNTACMANSEFTEKGMAELKDFFYKLDNINIKSLTIALPSLIELVKEILPETEIKVSAISNVISPDNALFYKKMGAKRLVPNTDINRNFTLLGAISKCFGDGVEIIVNSVCYKNCPYKIFHYNHESHSNNNQDVDNYYFHRCTMQKTMELKNMVRLNWIRPEDLNLYEDIGIHHFKLQGRNNVYNGDPAKSIEAYFKEEYEGNLYDLLTLFSPINSYHPFIDNKKLDGYIERFKKDPEFCKNICSECNYCDRFAQKSMDKNHMDELNSSTYQLYNGIDGYNKLVKQEKEKNEKKTIEATFSPDDKEDFNF
ncbi:MAG: hypothetical protein GQ564_08500 [Bacteroidales bacterium]|nr:hypothetical protein [Bacteroidales bacterium]